MATADQFGKVTLYVRSQEGWSTGQPLATRHAAFGASVALWEGGALIGANHWAVETGFGAYGKGVMLAYDLYAEPDTCEAAADCSSGHCVEHVCCDSACDAADESCRASRKGYGVDGFCGRVAVAATDASTDVAADASSEDDAGTENDASTEKPDANTECAPNAGDGAEQAATEELEAASPPGAPDGGPDEPRQHAGGCQVGPQVDPRNGQSFALLAGLLLALQRRRAAR